MTYNTVSVTGNNIFGNAAGEVVNVTFTPQSFYFDTPNNTQINPPAVSATSSSSGAWTVSGLIDPTTAGTGLAWTLTVTDKASGQSLYRASVQVAHANGASQDWLALTPPPAPAAATTYLVAGTPPTAASQFLQSTAANSNVLAYKYGMTPINILNFGADPTGAADSTTAINNAIAAATGSAAPATHSRACTNAVYLPSGTYRVSSDLLIQSVVGANFYGDGAELTILKASGSGFTTAVLNIDGSYAGRFRGFTILGDGTEQVTNAINLTWTTGAARSTTGNKIEDIRIRNLNFVNGVSMAGVTNRQVDSTRLDCVVVSGQQVAGAWLNTGNWQQGFVFGNGTFANIYDQVLTRCEPSGCYYGYYNNVSSFSLTGAQPGANYCDFYMNPAAQSTITNIQSQNSGIAVIAPSNFSPEPNSFNDYQFKTNYLQGQVIQLSGGTWNFSNFSAGALAVITSVASGSNGGEISQIATWSSPSAGVLDVASTANMSSGGGTVNVAASGSTTAVVTYTGIAAGQLTGCAYVSGSASGTVATGGTVSGYVPGGITLAGSASVRPAVVNFCNLVLFGARTSAFTLSNAVLTVQQYSNYNPLTGNYTAATGDPSSINVGGLWSSITGVTPPQVNFITATGNTNYPVPAGAQTVKVFLQGGGGQGGGGGLTASGAAGGGSGGSAGGYAWAEFPAAILSSPVTVTVGAGGTSGGQASTTPGSPGSNGQAGGTSLFGGYLWVHGGSAGQAGATAATAGGAQGGGIGMLTGGASGAGSATATTAGAGLGAGAASGGGGGGGTTGASDGNGGSTAASSFGASSNTGAGGIASSSTAATTPSAPTEGGPGAGGGGGYGKSGASSTAGVGAPAPASSGAGGGGGGGCSGGSSSGAGGNGGAGFALIIAYFQ